MILRSGKCPRTRRMPFLTRMAEERTEACLEGQYDEVYDIWTINGIPAIFSTEIALNTMTLTKADGESADRD